MILRSDNRKRASEDDANASGGIGRPGEEKLGQWKEGRRGIIEHESLSERARTESGKSSVSGARQEEACFRGGRSLPESDSKLETPAV